MMYRYVEYSGGRRVYASPWRNQGGAAGCPEGCLNVEMAEKEARKWKRRFEAEEKRQGCSNFEYKVV